jgi:hypothetical protein
MSFSPVSSARQVSKGVQPDAVAEAEDVRDPSQPQISNSQSSVFEQRPCRKVSATFDSEIVLQQIAFMNMSVRTSTAHAPRPAKRRVSPPVESAVARILDDLEQRGGLKGSDIANIVSTSRPTVSRWKSGKALPPLATQIIIADLRYVVDRMSDFYTPAETRLWLHAKHALLGNERAIDLIIADRTQEVLAVIERLDSSAYL